MSLIEVTRLIDKLSLAPHPEGGYFSESYRSQETIQQQPDRFHGEHVYKTAIYYLLERDNISAFHRLKQDELWHYYVGSSVILHILDPTQGYKQRLLGSALTDERASYQVLVPQNVWFAAELKDKTQFSLVGCTTSPGFEFSDWELAKPDTLIDRFPQQAELIQRLVAAAVA